MSSHHETIKNLTDHLEEWDYKINLLETRIKDLPDELKGNAEEKYQKLKEFQSTIPEKERALKDATEHAIHDIEASFKDLFDTFKLLFEDIELEISVEDDI